MTDEVRIALTALSNVFGALGRVLVCLDAEFRIVHISDALRDLVGTAADRLAGAPIEQLLGEDLFGKRGSMREPLLNGERREGWRAFLRTDEGLRLLSISAAPMRGKTACQNVVKYVVVLRPADEEPSDIKGPTVLSGIVARSPAMLRVFRLVENLQGSNATILLTGESGAGKEVVARALHTHSPRRSGSFVAVNCAALPADLLESELFGHVRGAFTGAIRDRVGRFELASNGTLFLDEIGDMPLQLQVKLLRVLQERTFERVGENRQRTTDARIIAATNIDLAAAVKAGRFREDLYYRLRVVPIDIPPLRTRREDIEPLARLLLARVAERHGRQLRFSPDAIRVLLHHSWPGNVRELENAIEYAVAVVKGQTILPEDLPPEVGALGGTEEHEPPMSEAEQIRAALESAQWRRDVAAANLHMSRSTLWRKMREYGLLRNISN